MNHRRKHLFWIMVIGLALYPSQSTIQAQTATPSPGPTPTPSATSLPGQEVLIQPYTLTSLYGQPSVVYTDLGGDLYSCQNPAQTVASSPSDITRIEVYTVPDNFASLSGYVIAAYTATPFEQLLSEYSAAMLFRSATVGGQTEHRVNEIHEGQARIGAINNNNQLIDGTSQLASVSPDGMAAVVNVPDTVSQFQFTSYYTAQAGQDTTCDVAPNNGLFRLNADWNPFIPDEAARLLETTLVTGTDERDDAVVCGVPGAARAYSLDISVVSAVPARFNMPYPDGFEVQVQTNRSAGEVFNEVVYLQVERGSGEVQNWLMANGSGRFSTRVQDTNNVPIYQEGRWGDFTGTSMAQPSTSSALAIFNIPGDTTAIQAFTALTAEQGGEQVCDQYPSDGSWINLPPAWMAAVDTTNVAQMVEDPTGDVVDATTGASVDAPEADITTVNVFQGRMSNGNNVTWLGVSVGPPASHPGELGFTPRVLPGAVDYSLKALGVPYPSITLEQTGDQSTTRVTDGDGNALLTPYNLAYWDESQNTAYFIFTGEASQVTVEVEATMADGQEVVDTTDPIDLPVITFPTSARLGIDTDTIIICPQGEQSTGADAPDVDATTLEKLNEIVESIQVDYSRIRPFGTTPLYLHLNEPASPPDPILNPWVLTSECDDPQFAAPTAPPTVEDVYGAPVQTVSDPAGDGADCQNPAATAGTTPSDIEEIIVYRVPDNVVSYGGYVIAVNTVMPFQQVMGSSNSAALVVNAVTASGERANRRLQSHEGQESSGIIDDNSQLIAATGDFVGFDAFGRALFLVPPTTTQAQITSYYMGAAGQPTLCDTTGTINFDAFVVFGDKSLGEVFDEAGIIICPPLDIDFFLSAFDENTPNERITNAVGLLLLLFTPYQSSSSHYLALADPSLPYDPIFNPLVLQDDCDGNGES